MILICRTPNKEERLAGGTQSAQAKACGYQRFSLLPVTADLRLAVTRGGIMARTRIKGIPGLPFCLEGRSVWEVR